MAGAAWMAMYTRKNYRHGAKFKVTSYFSLLPLNQWKDIWFGGGIGYRIVALRLANYSAVQHAPDSQSTLVQHAICVRS